MNGLTAIAEVAWLIGDPARANILYALRDDGHVSAGDLAEVAGLAPSTTSGHLARLAEAGLVRIDARGRKRFYSLGDPAVAEILEGIEALVRRLSDREPEPLPWDRGRVHSRMCLDHLAGRLGAQLAGAAIGKDYIRHSARGLALTGTGAAWLGSLGVDVARIEAEPRRFLGLCPDWSRQMTHIGGAVGAAIYRGLVGTGWLRREPGSDRVAVTPKGVAGFRAEFGLDLREAAAGGAA
ncbi:ArsR family transcriptional regulator [Defluviimonas sp. WL0024]|uniref:ArsR family transcriptional regulator n=2 Tax=Albidovulum TaxID=205889 RepID=A0ABT3J7W5_9RHOB|nr:MULTISPECIES: helix-turn-helix transcriptional regulator [Defluviimonas]MCU9847982.1 ArsR family transcriptional regulator [Defluviimonas sp. WL0024]MCW3783784.1 ArsR family transcriptional regulator [Defluviimonas salinarum]